MLGIAYEALYAAMQTQTATTYQRRLGPVTSPVVSAAITRRIEEVKASSALRRAISSIFISLILLVDW